MLEWSNVNSEGAELTAFQPLRPMHFTGCRWFWAWALLGFAVAVGFVSLGLLAVAPAAVVGGLMVSRPVIRRSAFGLLSGAGVRFVYVAWIQRAGPGTTCWQTASASGCDQHLNPLPWAIAGVVLFRRRHHRPRSTELSAAAPPASRTRVRPTAPASLPEPLRRVDLRPAS